MAGTGRTKDSRRLGELLVEERIITPEQLEAAVREQETTGGYIGQILVQKGFATDQAISEYLVRQFKIPRLSLLDYDINDKVLRQIPEEVCLRLRLLAIDKLGRILTVAMVDPLDREALEEVQTLCPDLRIKPILCDWDHFEAVSKRLFGKVPQKPEFYAALRMEAPVKEPEKLPDPPPDTIAPDMLTRPAPAGMSAAVTRELAETLREGLRDALRDVVENITPPPSPPASSTGTEALGDFASRIESSVQESMRTVAAEFRRVSEDLRVNMEAVRPSGEFVSSGPTSEDLRHLARGIQEGVGEVMTKAMAALGEEMRSIASHRAVGGEPHGPSPAEIAEAMRQTLSPALESSISNLGRIVPRLEPNRGKPPAEHWHRH